MILGAHLLVKLLEVVPFRRPNDVEARLLLGLSDFARTDRHPGKRTRRQIGQCKHELLNVVALGDG